jgi:predicted AlkP superfamily phosphohydrolase/phosphomutase
LTGKSPGEHGIFHFVKLRNHFHNREQTELHSSPDIIGMTIFDIASNARKRIVAINVPMTYPPWKVDRFMISGRMAPERYEEFTNPGCLKRRIPSDYRIDLDRSDADWLHHPFLPLPSERGGRILRW